MTLILNISNGDGNQRGEHKTVNTWFTVPDIHFSKSASDSDKVPHAVALSVQVVLIVRVCRDADGHLLHYLKAVPGKSHYFLGVVGEESEFLYSEVAEDLCTNAVITQVRCKTEPDVGIHCIHALLLEFVGV